MPITVIDRPAARVPRGLLSVPTGFRAYALSGQGREWGGVTDQQDRPGKPELPVRGRMSSDAARRYSGSSAMRRRPHQAVPASRARLKTKHGHGRAHRMDLHGQDQRHAHAETDVAKANKLSAVVMDSSQLVQEQRSLTRSLARQRTADLAVGPKALMDSLLSTATGLSGTCSDARRCVDDGEQQSGQRRRPT